MPDDPNQPDDPNEASADGPARPADEPADPRQRPVERLARVAVVHGPNLNLLGTREPEVYGHRTLGDVNRAMTELAERLGVELEVFQSNSEGRILDFLARTADRVDGLVVNPAGLGHTSVALLDGLLALSKPFVEVHLSNPAARESFRRRSLIAPAALGVVAGFGLDSYLSGLRCLCNHLAAQRNPPA